MADRRRIRLLLLSVVASIMLLYPVLSVFDKPVLVGGLPMLFVYFFGIWAVVIVLTYIFVTDQNDRNKKI
jgi:hypothetical protein